ncbi:MSMEG_6728 family protein [Streptomyces sp. NPDC095817]|uniref:MSMEG_6728 family protein n=1 Tax=Streptomyces sp. NPDC095817 TaxID=3155082 RepID=UPI003323BD92
MQTFLPYPDFTQSAAVLDQARLGKQRVEALQVLRGLTVPGYGWRNHPAVRMWTGYEEALVRYGLDVCAMWVADGHADTCAATLAGDFARHRPGAGVRLQEQLVDDGELVRALPRSQPRSPSSGSDADGTSPDGPPTDRSLAT